MTKKKHLIELHTHFFSKHCVNLDLERILLDGLKLYVSSTVKVNGFLTEEISIKRGLRQGCPLSALLFVLCAEVLSINIRKNTDIKGIIYENQEHKESSFADDMNVVVSTDNSIYKLFELLDKYELATNSKINKDKTEAKWLGKWKDRTDKPLNLKWKSGEVMLLGVYVDNDRKKAAQRTFSEIRQNKN